MTLTAAKQRLQTLMLACSSSDVTIRYAPDNPVTSADVLPLSIAHLASGEGTADNATTVRVLPTIQMDVHFPRAFLKQVYGEIDVLAISFLQRLGGDPTLNGAVDNIIFPVTFDVSPDTYDNIETQRLRFEVPVKLRLTPVST